jgi:hypothetical protein
MNEEIKMKSLSFREMSALGSAAAVALMAYVYFPEALMLSTHIERLAMPHGSWQIMDKHSTLFRLAAGSISMLIVLQIIYHIIIGILWRNDAMEKRDERDRMVVLKAGRLGYYVLLVGLFVLISFLLVGNVSSLLAAQYAFMVVFAGEFVRYAATFVYYRLSI